MPAVPATPRSRRSSQSNLSDYSIDLDALAPSDQHGSSLLELSKPDDHAIDVVNSEDIDGPTDFTQNMEFWMSAKLPNVLKPTKLEGEKKDDLEEYIGSDESLPDSQADGTPKQSQKEAAEIEQEAEHGTSRPQEDDVDHSIMSDASFRHVNQGGMSFLSDIPEDDDTVGSPSSPRTVERTLPLIPTSLQQQPTVEEFEDSPIRPREIRSASSSAIGATLRSPEFTLSKRPSMSTLGGTRGGSSDTIKSLEEALDQLRVELAEVRARSREEISRLRKDHETQISEQRTFHQAELGRTESAWKDRSARSNEIYEERISNLETQQETTTAKNAQTISSLQVKLRSATEALGSKDAKISSLEQQLDTERIELQRSRNATTSLQRDIETRAEKYRITSEEAEEERRESAEQYESLQSSYERLEASKMDTEDKVEALEAEVEKHKATHDKEVSNIKSSAEDSITRARREFEGEKAHFSLQLDTIREEREDLRAKLAMLESTPKDTSGKDIPRPKATATEKELDSLRAQLEKERSQHSHTLQDLESSKSVLKSALEDQRQALQDLQTANSILRTSVQDQDLALKVFRATCKDQQLVANNAQQEAAQSREEIQTLREDFDAVNSAVDSRLLEMLKLREAEWTRKYDALKRERGVMGKVLMREWGAKEVGGGNDPQAYRYKLV